MIWVIFLLVELLLKGENSILATNSDKSWETPWDWEITWQVLIVGFFFVGQFVLPLILGTIVTGIAPDIFLSPMHFSVNSLIEFIYI